MQPQLIDFLAQPTSIAKLVEYLVMMDNSETLEDSLDDGIEYTGSSVEEGGSSCCLNEIEANAALQVANNEQKSKDESKDVDASKGEESATETEDYGVSKDESRSSVNKELMKETVPHTEDKNDNNESKKTTLSAPLSSTTSDSKDINDASTFSPQKTDLLPSVSPEQDDGPIFIEEDVSHDDEEEDKSMRRVRFPYMACEIVCCENSRILDILVNGKNENGVSFLDRLFSVLDLPPGKIDDRHAGYFEKVREVKSIEMSAPMCMNEHVS